MLIPHLSWVYIYTLSWVLRDVSFIKWYTFILYRNFRDCLLYDVMTPKDETHSGPDMKKSDLAIESIKFSNYVVARKDKS